MPRSDKTQPTAAAHKLTVLVDSSAFDDRAALKRCRALPRVGGSASSLAVFLTLGLLVAATACSKLSSNNSATGGGSGRPSSGATEAGASNSASGGAAQAGAPSTAPGGAAQAGSLATSAVPQAGTSSLSNASQAGSSASLGSAGQAGAAAPACINSVRWQGAITKPNPWISVGKPVTSNSTDTANIAKLTDGAYNNATNGVVMTPAKGKPTWASINIGKGPTKLLLSWRNAGNEDYGPSLYAQTTYASALVPAGYLVKTSADSTNGDDGIWTTVATVTGNQARSRSHVVEFTGQAWVRFEVTDSVAVTAETMRAVRLDEIELHDISAAGPNDKRDTWFMMGDSITKMALDRNRGPNEIDKLITVQRPAFSPALVLAGCGGEKLPDALRHLKTEDWLKYSEGLDFVTLAFGTNDSWDSKATPQSTNFEANLREIITLLQANGRTPVLARIPWNTVSPYLSQFNEVIDKLQKEYDLPCGPDLYSWFAGHQDQLGPDHVHPANPSGYNSVNQQYAQAILPLYATAVSAAP